MAMKIINYIFILAIALIYGNNHVAALFNAPAQQKVVMINPAGDAKHPGRKLSNNYERAITFKCAEKLGKELESRYGMKVILTRVPGDEVVPLQCASLANRSHINFFIELAFYKREAAKPKVYLMHRMLDKLTDLARRSFSPLDLIPVAFAHRVNLHTTQSYSERIAMALAQSCYQKLFDFSDLHGLPLKPLEGITAPAVLFEIGINEEDKWPSLVEPIAESLKFLLDY